MIGLETLGPDGLVHNPVAKTGGVVAAPQEPAHRRERSVPLLPQPRRWLLPSAGGGHGRSRTASQLFIVTGRGESGVVRACPEVLMEARGQLSSPLPQEPVAKGVL